MTLAPWSTAYLIPAAMAAGSLPVMAASESSGSSYSRVTWHGQDPRAGRDPGDALGPARARGRARR